MHKDPLAREREFRERIEQAAREQRAARIRRSRPWIAWLRALGALLSERPWLWLSLLFLVPFAGLLLYVFGLHAKGTGAYACALAEARRSPLLAAELGEPVEAGLFAWSRWYIREGSVTDAAFSTSLAGPKGEGTLRVNWYRTPANSSLYLELEKDGRTHPLYAGPVPCR